MLDRRRSDLLHGGARFVTQDLEDALDTRLTEGTKAPQIGPPDAYRLGAHGQSLDGICAATEAAVDQHSHPAADRFDNLRQDLDCRSTAIDDTPAVVRNNNSVDTVVGGELCVFPRQDAFEHDFHFDCVAQALDPVPGHGCDVQAGGVAEVNAPVVGSSRDIVLSITAMAAIAFPRIGA